MSDEDGTGAEQPEEAKPNNDGFPTGNQSIADHAEEAVPEVPTATPMGEGQLALPGLGRRGGIKPPVEQHVRIAAVGIPGAGQIDPEKEHLMVVRVVWQKQEVIKVPGDDNKVAGWKATQVLRPTWAEALPDFLEKNGMAIIARSELKEGDELVNLGELADIEQYRIDALTEG